MKVFFVHSFIPHGATVICTSFLLEVVYANSVVDMFIFTTVHYTPPFTYFSQRIDKILRKCGAKWSLLSLLTDEGDKEKIHFTGKFENKTICIII